MKHLKEFKYFERFGIINDMEEQVSAYIQEVRNNPDKKSFQFKYKMSTKNGIKLIPFDLSFDKNINGQGEMNTIERFFSGTKFSIVM